MKDKHRFPRWIALLPLALITLLSGCEQMVVFDPKGPVAQQQSDLIMFSIWFMLGIIVVVFGLFTFMIIKYRDRPGRGDEDYDPN